MLCPISNTNCEICDVEGVCAKQLVYTEGKQRPATITYNFADGTSKTIDFTDKPIRLFPRELITDEYLDERFPKKLWNTILEWPLFEVVVITWRHGVYRIGVVNHDPPLGVSPIIREIKYVDDLENFVNTLKRDPEAEVK